jgi:hypothetical protein
MKIALRQRLSDFFASVARVFMPPFTGLPVVMWCFFVFAYIALPGNPVWLGDLPDPDDYTYLTQTLDWLQGQGWYDNVQHRMDPPLTGIGGVPIHYTRLAEMPIAASLMLFRLFHYSWHGAALLASFLLPVIYLGVLFAALRWAAARFVAPGWAALACFIVMFGNALMFKFAPGQVDHHGLEAILTITALGLAAQMFATPTKIRWALACGFTLALATAIALETLPWMTLISAAIGLWCLAQGRPAMRATVVFALSLAASNIGLLVLIKPPPDFFQPDLLAYSAAYVVLAAAITKALLIAAGLGWLKDIRLRFVLGGISALALGALYLWWFPDLLAGPYGAMDKRLAALFFANLEEAEPMIERYTLYQTLLCLAPSLIGLAASLSFMREAQGEKKWSWGMCAALLTTALALAAFYQIRVLIYASLFSTLPLTMLVVRGWDWIGERCEGRDRFWAEIALILLIGPLTAVLLPALQDGRSFNTGVVLFPAQTFDDTCQMRGLEKVLTATPYADRAPLRIINMIDSGPELLFRTPHAVLSAPYHTNVHGNLDALDFFSAPTAAQAQALASRDGIDLVVMCRDVPDMYLAGEGPHYVKLPDGEKRMRPNSSFAGQLALRNIPGWLTEIPVPQPANFLLFEVKKP